MQSFTIYAETQESVTIVGRSTRGATIWTGISRNESMGNMELGSKVSLGFLAESISSELLCICGFQPLHPACIVVLYSFVDFYILVLRFPTYFQ